MKKETLWYALGTKIKLVGTGPEKVCTVTENHEPGCVTVKDDSTGEIYYISTGEPNDTRERLTKRILALIAENAS